jgi:hypothetical protein
MAKNRRGSGHEPAVTRKPKSPSVTMKTCLEGERFPGKIGRTAETSEPAFPSARKAPEGAPNVLYSALDDVGFGWADTFGGLDCWPTGPGHSLDKTFDVGCDEGAPVTSEYPALASFSGIIIKVELELKPDFTASSERHAEAQLSSVMLRV